MYSDYLGEGYHERVRKLLMADDKICTNRMIDSDIIIGGMKKVLAPYLEGSGIFSFTDKINIKNEEEFAKFQETAIYILAGLLCSPIISRSKAPPFLGPKYKKNWKKKQEKLMKRGHMVLQALRDKEEVQ